MCSEGHSSQVVHCFVGFLRMFADAVYIWQDMQFVKLVLDKHMIDCSGTVLAHSSEVNG